MILANALRTLLKEKTFENITVENILELSGVSRATFYRHFQDKYSLMSWIYKAKVDEILKENPSPSQSINILVQSAYFIHTNKDYFSQIIKFQGQNSFLDFIFSYVKNATVDRISNVIGKKDLPSEMLYYVRFYCGGIVFIITEWLNSGLEDPPEKVAQLIFDCIPQPIKIYME